MRLVLAFPCLVLALAAVGCTDAGPGAEPTDTLAPTATPRLTAPPTPTPVPATPAPTPPATPPGPSSIYDPAADPSADIAAALAAAAGDGKPVLLDFGADWCPDCIVLTRMLEMPEFADYLRGVHVVRIDVGTWDHNLDVAKAYGDPIATGIPAVVLLSPQGKVLGSTADGRLASAASMNPIDVLHILQSLGG